MTKKLATNFYMELCSFGYQALVQFPPKIAQFIYAKTPYNFTYSSKKLCSFTTECHFPLILKTT